MVQFKVGQTWKLKIPAKGSISDTWKVPFKPGDEFEVNILAVNVMDFTCTIAAPGLGWTDRVSFEFLSDAGTLVDAA